MMTKIEREEVTKMGKGTSPDDSKSTEEDAKPGIISMDETVLGSSEATSRQSLR